MRSSLESRHPPSLQISEASEQLEVSEQRPAELHRSETALSGNRAPSKRRKRKSRRSRNITNSDAAGPEKAPLRTEATNSNPLNFPAVGDQFDPGEQAGQSSVPISSAVSTQKLLRDLDRVPGGGSSQGNVSHRTSENPEAHRNRYLGIPGPNDHLLYVQGQNEKTRLLSDFTVCSDRGLDLEGQHIARVAGLQEAINYEGIASPYKLIKKIRNDLEPTLSSFFGRSESYFLPWTKLHSVLSTQTVLRLLRHLNKKITGASQRADNDLPALASKIAPPLSKLGSGQGVNGQLRRTFATLILVGRESMVFAFVDAGLDDGSLLEIDFDGLTPISNTEKALKDLFRGWKPREIKDFKSLRWQLSPTFFSVKREFGSGLDTDLPDGMVHQGVTLVKRVRYKLRSTEEVLPFQSSKRPAISGGFADVRFFKLHEDQQDLPRFTRRGKDNDIAVKTLKNEPKGTAEQFKAYENEAYVMARIASAIDTPHMAKLLATIEVPRAAPDRERSDYHIVLEAADRTVEKLWCSHEWWNQYPARGITDLDLTKWVASQCYGLADALWKFHVLPKKDGDLNEKRRGLHCDIKPDNILHYEEWAIQPNANPKATVHERLGVLQLSDFGLSSFHSTRSVENHRIAGDFLDYAAPETDFLLTHSPAADIWHLGCLFMDFATWLLDGPEGYKRFCDGRLTTVLRGRRCRFATFTQDVVSESNESTAANALSPSRTPKTYVDVNRAVLEQGTYLCQHKKSSEFIRELCHLAINYMLVMRDTNQKQKVVEYRQEPQAVADRLTSKQVAEILRRSISRSDEYFRPSRADILPFEHNGWRRSSLLLYYDVKQLQRISQKVRSGLDPEEAGLKMPGVTEVRGEVEPSMV